jgi:hypothetical protein
MAVRTFTVYGYDGIKAAEALAPGETVYPIHYTHIHEGGKWYYVTAQPGRKNMSHEPCERGWLGTTNNVQATALGSGEVVSVNVRTLKDGRERADIKVRM